MTPSTGIIGDINTQCELSTTHVMTSLYKKGILYSTTVIEHLVFLSYGLV